MKDENAKESKTTKFMRQVVIGLGVCLVLLSGLSFFLGQPSPNNTNNQTVKEANPFG